MKSKIKAFVFDMDGLIFDSERIVQRAWDIAGQQFGITHMGEHIYQTIGMNAAGRKSYFQQAISPEFPFEEFTEQTRKEFRRIVELEGVPMKAGAHELIVLAKEQGYKLAVATSSSRVHATRLLKDAGIDQYFDGMVFGDMVTHSKPAPEIYERACEEIGELPKNCIAFEDAPLGVRSAATAGLRVVVVPDLVQPSEEIRCLAWKEMRSLEEMITYMKNDRRMVLASASPRRSELMKLAGFDFEIKVSEKEETYQSSEPSEIVKELSLLKAEDVAEQLQAKDVVVIGADTIVSIDGKVLGKPQSKEDAFQMIQALQGKKHQVYTGVAILMFDKDGNKKTVNHAVRTDVFVHAMEDCEIAEYMAHENVMDKAGAYGIQGRFAIYIDKIEGDYYNVMGLPISYIYQVLKEQ